MRQKYLGVASVAALMLSSGATQALPFNSFDPRSMAMGGVGVAVGDPSTAPFFNPALLSASNPSKKFALELPIIGGRLYDPGNLRSELPTLSDNATALSNAVTPLSNSSSTLSTDISTLTGNITTINSSIASVAALGSVTVSTLSTAQATLSTLATNVSTVSGNMSTVASDMTTVSGNATTVSTNLTKVNQSLSAINNKPLQGEFGAATVIAVPGKNWGMSFYANAWGAVGGELVYKDATTISNISSAITTTSSALTSSSSATTASVSALNAASTALNTAVSDCSTASITAAGNYTTCTSSLATANTLLATAKTSLTSTSSTLSTNASTVTTAASTVSTNKTVLSQVHLRGVAVSEAGFSLSHGLIFHDQAWSVGVTPKFMQLQLFDAYLDANSGGNGSGVNGSDYLAKYSTLNFDMGAVRDFENGWRSGLVVKNVLPQTFDFKSIGSGAKTGSAQSVTGTLSLNPQVRAGLSHENAWSTVGLDVDLTKNDPAGMENQSQYVALGGELSALGWAQLRAGYRADMINSERNVASLGLGISPRIPYFKPHFDLAVAGNTDATTKELGASLRFGMNF